MLPQAKTGSAELGPCFGLLVAHARRYLWQASEPSERPGRSALAKREDHAVRSTTFRVHMLWVLNLALVMSGPAMLYVDDRVEPLQDPGVAFVNVNVVPMDEERILYGHTVIVRDGVIRAVGPSAGSVVPGGATVIEGEGRLYLVPGLADMHVHLASPDMLTLFIGNGVTTVRNMRGDLSHLRLRDSIARGERSGPTIYTAGPFVNEPVVITPEQAERSVLYHKEMGYDFIKIHGRLPRETYHRLKEVAREHGIPVIGHAPRNLSFDAVLEGGQASIAHAEEMIYTYFQSIDESRIPEFIERARAAGLWVAPTLSTFENIVRQWGRPQAVDAALERPEVRYLSPGILEHWQHRNAYTGRRNARLQEDRYRFQLLLVKRLHDAGVRLLAGTDTPLPVMYPGFSIYEELENLVRAGLTPFEALVAATRNPGAYIAEFVSAGDRFGTVAVGQRADLVLLAANPLEGVANLTRRVGVMVRGRWFPQVELQRMLDSLAVSYRE